MGSVTRKPANLTLGKIYREDFPSPMRTVDFLNHTPWYVYVLFGSWDESLLDSDPDWVLKPYSSQILQPARPSDRMLFQARTDWPIDDTIGDTSPRFGYVGSDSVDPGGSSYKGVGISGQVINVSRSDSVPFISAKLTGDAFNRLELFADGSFFIGQGNVAPQQLWDSPAPGTISFLNPPELHSGAIPDFSDWQFVTANWVAQEIAAGAFTPQVADNSKASSAAPSTYPAGLSMMRRTDGGGSWPGSSTGLAFTVKATTGSSYTFQFFEDIVNEVLYYRLGNIGDSWLGFGIIATQAWTNAQDTNNPAPAGVWTEIFQVRVVKSRVGLVQVEGRVENNTGAQLASGQRIFTVPALYRPFATGNKFWACCRFPDTAPNTAGFEQIMPVWYDSATFQVKIGDALNNGARVDISPLTWIA